jgi:predicted DNA-binding transcriptional regulator YafY
MPKASTRDTLLRQWEILQLLTHGGPGKSHSQILEELNEKGYSVTKRTIERDLEQLSETFPQIECNKKGTPWGWRWGYGASINIPGISITEALSTELIKNTLRPLLPASILKPVEPHFEQASARLKLARSSNQIASWADKVYQIDPTMPLVPPTIDSDVLDAVQSALMADKQLEVEYQSFESDKAEPRRLHPLGLVQRGPVSYLIATAFNYNDVLIWALHRMHSAEVLPENLKMPEGFSLEEYVKSGKLHFGSTKPIKLKAELNNELAKILGETPLSEDQKITQNSDTCTVTATVADTWQLRWWIMSQGVDIEILSPKALRKSIAESLKEAYEQYVTDS